MEIMEISGNIPTNKLSSFHYYMKEYLILQKDILQSKTNDTLDLLSVSIFLLTIH